jgi:hypothetical protein
MTTKDEALALALEALEEHDGNYAQSNASAARVIAAITAIKQAQDGALIDEGTKQQAITPETGNAAPPEASAITAGNGQAQEPVNGAAKEWTPDMAHLANEWADAATNGPVILDNVRSGIYTFEEAKKMMTADFEHCREVARKVKATHPAPKQAEPALTAHEQRCADVATAMFRNREGIQQIKAAITDPEGHDKAQIEKAVYALINVATFGSNSKREDGSPTPNRLRQLESAKYLHSLVSNQEFEVEHAFLLGHFAAVERSTETAAWRALVSAASEVIDYTEAAHRPPVRDVLEAGRMVRVRLHALASLYDALNMLPTPPETA